eukprot:scaffold10938_cov123-Isochrysis_galbana.AAC.3
MRRPPDRGTRACSPTLGTKRLALHRDLEHVRVGLDRDDRRDRRRALHIRSTASEFGTKAAEDAPQQKSDDAAHHEEFEPHAASNPPGEAPPPRRRARRSQTWRTRRVVEGGCADTRSRARRPEELGVLTAVSDGPQMPPESAPAAERAKRRVVLRR